MEVRSKKEIREGLIELGYIAGSKELEEQVKIIYEIEKFTIEQQNSKR